MLKNLLGKPVYPVETNDKKRLTTGGKIALAVWLLISLVGYFFTISDLILKPFLRPVSLAAVVLYLIAAFYIFFGYQIPHSNLFRYSLLVYALALGLMHNTPLADVITRAGVLVCAALIAYMSGRLHKFHSCCNVIVAVEVILLASSIRTAAFSPLEAAGITIVTPSKVAFFNPPILWGSFAIAYLTRFSQHREAGTNTPVTEKNVGLPQLRNRMIVVQTALCLIGIVITVVAICLGSDNLVADVTAIVLYGIALYYVFWGYKTPHGNLFRYSLLVYAGLSGLMFNGADIGVGIRAASIVSTMLAAFMSGRLNKVRDCRYIIPAVAVIQLVVAIIRFVMTAGTLPVYNRLLAFNHPILWGCFAVAYLIRYQQHKEAGEGEEA